MWEWSHSQPVQNVRPPGVFAKVNRVRFTSQGNKFGACDGDGNVALWQAANASQPFFVRPEPRRSLLSPNPNTRLPPAPAHGHDECFLSDLPYQS